MTKGIKRYNLALPTELFDALQDEADKNGTTVVDLIRKFIKLGLFAATVTKDEDAELIIRQGDSEKTIVIF